MVCGLEVERNLFLTVLAVVTVKVPAGRVGAASPGTGQGGGGKGEGVPAPDCDVVDLLPVRVVGLDGGWPGGWLTTLTLCFFLGGGLVVQGTKGNLLSLPHFWRQALRTWPLPDILTTPTEDWQKVQLASRALIRLLTSSSLIRKASNSS